MIAINLWGEIISDREDSPRSSHCSAQSRMFKRTHVHWHLWRCLPAHTSSRWWCVKKKSTISCHPWVLSYVSACTLAVCTQVKGTCSCLCDRTQNISIGNTAATAATARGGTKRLVGKWQVSVCFVLALGAIQLPNICYKRNTRVWSRTNGLFSPRATSAGDMLAYKLNTSQVDLIYFNLSSYPSTVPKLFLL